MSSGLPNTHYSISTFLLAVLFIIGVGAIGLTYYTHQVPRMLQTKRASSTTQVTTTNSLSIPELDIKLALPNGLTPGDLQYDAQIDRPGTTADPHLWSSLAFTTKSLLQLDSGCTAAEGSIGAIIRYSEDPRSINAVLRESRPLGNYYFGFAAPQGPCSLNPNAEKLQLQQIQMLQQAFDSVTAAN